ncbi:DNA-binding protein [Sulfurifustis variabilis]|uniref:DNA-binding protein n=1 Tax=Sulfurifustis variabilis TaxID=1675686 RepID=A0A1B4UZN7_9GAMM|nr:DNA-processing protein DprA [Sulfurifustis variabilis]BAU46606.1 DNA-binding protein [Sulfurifustis variabilis]
MDADRLALWLTLVRVPGLGTRGRRALLEQLGTIEAVFAASRVGLASAFEAATGEAPRPEAIDTLLAGPDASRVGPDLAWLAEPDRCLVTWTDPDYPPLLREIADAPVALYVRGERAALAEPQLAIVGSRNASLVGQQNAAAFARALARAGLTITSGLAMGVDAAAHRGALEAGGRTVAVAGHGLDLVYPARHRELAEAIARRGALVSEFPIGTPPHAGNFPVRNRIISGLATGVLVVEAALRSGSLITARLAAEQGREVFALPGSIHSPLARGCHALIRQGAKLVEDAGHVLEELGALLPSVPSVSSRSTHEASNLDDDARRLLRLLSHDPLSIDALIEHSGLTPDIVSSILLTLELRGLVTAGPGATYQRAAPLTQSD